MSSHNLAIEDGRHTNTPSYKNSRCEPCHLGIADEFRFVFKGTRCKYIEKYYCEKASASLLIANNFIELCNLGCYLQTCFERREIIIRSFSV